MKCALCSKTIDHEKVIPPEHVQEQRTHAAALSEWEQVTVQIWRGSGSVTAFQGHICPNHKDAIDQGRLIVAVAKG